MKRIALTLLCLFLALPCFAQYLGNIQSDVVFARQPSKTFANLTNVISLIGTRQRTLVIDGGGTWLITDSVTIPTNINLLVASDTLVSIASGKTFQVDGFISSGDWQIFSGLGVVTGPCDNAFVYTDWVATNHTIAWLGTPFSSVVSDLSAYMTGAAITNLLNAHSNAMVAFITNQDALLKTDITNWATNLFVKVGETVTVDSISFTDFPLYGYSMNNSGGQAIGVTNTLRVLTNFIPVHANNYSSRWSQTATFIPPKPGLWLVNATLNTGHGVGITESELFMVKNQKTNFPNASTFKLIDKSADNVFSVNSVMGGTVRLFAAATNEQWQFYFRSTATAAVNYGYADISYMGDPALAR